MLNGAIDYIVSGLSIATQVLLAVSHSILHAVMSAHSLDVLDVFCRQLHVIHER